MSRRPRHNVYRDGKVHVCERMCPTCIFRPDTKMDLVDGRVEQMVAESLKNETAIICHDTLYVKNPKHAVCRGFFDRHKTQPLQIAERLGRIEFVKSEKES